MWPCLVALSLTRRHPAASGLAPTISTSRQVTVSQQVTTSHGTSQLARKLAMSRAIRAELNRTPLPHLGRAGLDTAFPGDSKCLNSCSQQHALDQRVGDVGRMAEDGRPLIFGHQLGPVADRPYVKGRSSSTSRA